MRKGPYKNISVDREEARRRIDSDFYDNREIERKRHYEPDLTPEVIEVQDRMIARFGRHLPGVVKDPFLALGATIVEPGE